MPRFLPVILPLLAVLPALARAESHSHQAPRNVSHVTITHVDFTIVIPEFLFLRVGSGTGTAYGGFTDVGSIDHIVWTPSAAQVGQGALSASGGDLSGGVETAVVVANNGNVTLSATTNGPLSDGRGDTISYAAITTSASHYTTGTTLVAPSLADGATNTVMLTAVHRVVQQDARWAYTYANAEVPGSGAYGGVNTNNGRVTYTASLP